MSLPKFILEDATPTFNVRGWLYQEECRLLYKIAKTLDGSILEIGPFIGKSTCYIAAGLRDSNKSRDFVSVELSPTESELDVIGGGALSHLDDIIRPALNSKGGIFGELTRNIEANGFTNLVQLVKGDFRQIESTYDFVFCDCIHNMKEIQLNLIDVADHVKLGGIIAIHDIPRAFLTYDVITKLHIKSWFSFYNLFVGEIE